MSSGVRSSNDAAVADLLQALGLRRNVAWSLTVLARQNEVVSADVERATGLRQPEVSLAMRRLRERGWVEKRDLPRAGKGRPQHAYRLAEPFDGVLASIEREKRDAADRDADNLGRLRKLLHGGTDR